jgi:K+-sensing histidine kinase KdpD
MEVASRITYEVAVMQIQSFKLAYWVIFTLGLACSAVAQENRNQQPSAREQLQQIYTPQSIDQELSRLTKDLELTPEQQRKVRPLLQQHHDKIQALLDKSPNVSRQDLGPQIHAISDETHRQIHALLTDHQKELEKAMQQREHNGEENRRPAPPPAAAPDPFVSVS